MFFKEPLSAMVEKKAQKMEGGVGMFITQGVFELFEVLLMGNSTTKISLGNRCKPNSLSISPFLVIDANTNRKQV